jgi:hypothetical protein
MGRTALSSTAFSVGTAMLLAGCPQQSPLPRPAAVQNYKNKGKRGNVGRINARKSWYDNNWIVFL